MASRKDGLPCRMPPLAGGSFCWAHDADRADARSIARQEGGHHRHPRTVATETLSDSNDVSLQSVAAALRLLERTAADTVALANSTARNRTLALIVQVAIRAVELGVLEERLEALEERQRVEQLRGGKWQRNGA
jgi:hypothetical protein